MAEPPPGLVIRAATAADVPALCSLANEPGYRWGTLRLPFRPSRRPAAGSPGSARTTIRWWPCSMAR